MECPTVRIKATTGSYPFTTINESDFDPAKHERYIEGAVTKVFPDDEPQYGHFPSAIAEDIATAAMKMDEVLTPAAAPKRGRK